jgi:hypothetical protein
MKKRLRVALPVAALAATAFAVLPVSTASGDEGGNCVPAKQGVTYAYEWNETTASITLTPASGELPRCEDVTVSLAGWQFLNPPSQWPQQATFSKTITLAADATEPVSASGPATCQNDAYWGEGPEVGTINTKAGDPYKEVFVNHQLDNGTGANWAADPMTGGLTASLGPCSSDSNGGDGGGDVAGPTGNDPVLNPRPGKLPHTGR